MISVEKPGSPSEILEHHGVKGQKWGVRSARNTRVESRRAGREAGRGAAKTVRKAGGNREAQKTAARTVGGAAAKDRSAQLRGTTANRKASQKFKQNFPTGKARAQEIFRARAAMQMRAVKYHATPKNSPERAAAKKAYLSHPDRATALRATRGEKVVDGILLGALGGLVGTGAAVGAPVVVPAAGAAGLAGAIGGIALGRRHIERKQARGAYG